MHQLLASLKCKLQMLSHHKGMEFISRRMREDQEIANFANIARILESYQFRLHNRNRITKLGKWLAKDQEATSQECPVQRRRSLDSPSQLSR